MKEIIGYLKTFYREEWNWRYVLLLALFLAPAIYCNYAYHLSDRYVSSGEHARGPRQLLYNFVFNVIPLLYAYLAYLLAGRPAPFLKSGAFWMQLIFALFIFSFRTYFYWHRTYLAELVEPQHYYYWRKCANNLVPALLLILPLLLYWLGLHRKEQAFYGYSSSYIHLKPYFQMLLIMLPLILAAGTQADFLAYYPVVRKALEQGMIHSHQVLHTLFFELCYGIDFLATETFFRGFLILAFVKYAGRAAILPMVCFYVTIHFGKPLGETISSFFGGLVLGILAYETRSIWGGVIAHLGVAWMMELVAWMMR